MGLKIVQREQTLEANLTFGNDLDMTPKAQVISDFEVGQDALL